jgi:hypothetical protein
VARPTKYPEEIRREALKLVFFGRGHGKPVAIPEPGELASDEVRVGVYQNAALSEQEFVFSCSD